MKRPDSQYTSGEYVANNPTWDVEDSPWKANKVAGVLSATGIRPDSICEVGCGAGGVLASLREVFPGSGFHGYDISPDAAQFWGKHRDLNIQFHVGDFFELNERHYDVILVLDVLEHVIDPWTFLEGLKPWGDHFLFHIPLDLSAASILRESPILDAREKVGHIHYFTKNLALKLLAEAGFSIEFWAYSGLSMSGPRHSWRSRFAFLPRLVAYGIHKDLGVRLLGGESLLVMAKPSV